MTLPVPIFPWTLKIHLNLRYINLDFTTWTADWDAVDQHLCSKSSVSLRPTGAAASGPHGAVSTWTGAAFPNDPGTAGRNRTVRALASRQWGCVRAVMG